MGKLSIEFSYVSLEKAGELLGVSASDLIHAGAHDQIQICANIYGRADGIGRTKIQAPKRLPKRLPNGVSREEAQAFQNWWNRCSRPMPDGIYEIGQDTLRFFEMPETKEFELYEGYKRDDSGWWDVEFDPPVAIDRGDLVILSSEIERVTAAGGVDTKPIDKPLSKRERDTLLTIIAALCKVADYDASKHAKTAGLIQNAAAGMGVSIGETTIEGHLKKIPDALATRMK